ncbi:MAG: hypothetical protein HUU43_11670 [Ignavibacteriaceae bacterium]|nr:hypothetical protein [Ignavibacteriaceae bacterium]
MKNRTLHLFVILLIMTAAAHGCSETKSDAYKNTGEAPAGGSHGIEPNSAANYPRVLLNKDISYAESKAEGNDIVIMIGGMGAKREWVDAWTDELYRSALDTMGVKHVFTVKGPDQEYYDKLEIKVDTLINKVVKLADSLSAEKKKFRILIIAHSSGVFPAHQILDELYVKGKDKNGVTAGRIHYFQLDGDPGVPKGYPLTAAMVNKLARMYIVYAFDKSTLTISAMHKESLMLYAMFGSKSELVAVDASDCGCNPEKIWCLHETMITSKPHNKNMYDLAQDYTKFDKERKVTTSYLKAIYK